MNVNNIYVSFPRRRESHRSAEPAHAGAPPARGNAGFTLVELIVASTLMALVLSGVYLTFSTTVRTWRAGESNYAPYQDTRRALGLLDHELNSIPVAAQHLFSGHRDEIAFVTLAPTLDVEAAPDSSSSACGTTSPKSTASSASSAKSHS